MSAPLHTVPLAASEVSRLRQCTVTVKKGPDKGATARLESGALVIGTADDCDLRLTDDTVSGRHCELVIRDDQIVVRDLGSRNGTLLNSVRVIEAVAEKGAELKLGNSRLVVEPTQGDVLVSKEPRFGPLIGKSAAMRALFAQLPPIAASSAPVLIEGETGAGKDLTAEALHQASPRAGGPFMLFDCGAVAPTLVEAELFGHEKNAFTGATAARAGVAEEANGGTLVLDEVGELPLELQPKLLRLAEKQEIRRVGSSHSVTLDVRIIACTHRSLKAEIAAGRFREDLYYRLSALRLRLPSLRERRDDVPALVDALLEGKGAGLRFDHLPENDRAMLLSHQWPGNVRELRNAVERLLAFPDAKVASLLEVEQRTQGEKAVTAAHVVPLPLARQAAQDAFEKSYLTQVLARADGSVTEAARIAGVSRQFVQRLLKKHGLRGRDT
jgi:DNA-binding NtrC family response regulator